MNSVLITSESRYPIKRSKIKEIVAGYLGEVGVDDVEISLAIVGSRKVRQLNKNWRKEDEETAVLTFGLEEPRDEDGILRIGDIVISYPAAREIAQDKNLTMDKAIEELLIHGLNNLFGRNKLNDNLLSQIPTTKISGVG